MKMLITVDGKPYHVEVEILDGPDHVSASEAAQIPIPSPLSTAIPPVNDSGEIESPIAGNVAEVLVKPGDVVAVNDTLVVLEVMKMESNVASPFAGMVKAVHVKPGDTVKRHDILVLF